MFFVNIFQDKAGKDHRHDQHPILMPRAVHNDFHHGEFGQRKLRWQISLKQSFSGSHSARLKNAAQPKPELPIGFFVVVT
jgi:hypothetical protein